MVNGKRIAVIIPCYKVQKEIEQVVRTVPDFVDGIFVIDDRCPAESGKLVQALNLPRVKVLLHQVNQGVGGAMITGFQAALAEKYDVMVKIDGDGQMDPTVMEAILEPVAHDEADYSKGNRFFWPSGLKSMPLVRKIGNAGLSFLNKLSSGYWDIMDPTNGYLAISASALSQIDLDKVSKRYFFESDMLFRLGIIRAMVVDVPMTAVYGSEVSNLRVGNSVVTFFMNHIRRTIKRIVYLYFIRDFNQGSLSLIFAIPFLIFAIIFGGYKWWLSLETGIPTPSGTIFVAVLPFIVGFQLLLNFLNYDVSMTPKKTITAKKHAHK